MRMFKSPVRPESLSWLPDLPHFSCSHVRPERGLSRQQISRPSCIQPAHPALIPLSAPLKPELVTSQIWADLAAGLWRFNAGRPASAGVAPANRQVIHLLSGLGMKAMMVNNSSLQSSWALLTLQGELSAQRTSSRHGCPLKPPTL